jgi:hypothetical protein
LFFYLFPLTLFPFQLVSNFMKPKKHKISLCRPVAKTISAAARKSLAAVIGLAFVAVGATYGQVSSINSTVIDQDLFQPPIPGTFFLSANSYPSVVLLKETDVSTAGGNGFAQRDAWYFSANGSSAYQFQNNDYFNASFQLTLTGNNPNAIDLEAGWLFSNPSGSIGGDLQSLVTKAGVVVQFGGPSYYPFSPAAGGYPGAGGSVANYVLGQTYTLGLNYVVDPNTGNNAFQYSVNGQWAASAPGNTYFDLGPGAGPGGSPGSTLGGYLQIQTDPNFPSNTGQAVFSDISIVPVPEPSSLALLGTGFLTLLPRFLRGRRV